jgi:hypothetical protein
MMIFQWVSRALLALLVTGACGYFLWVEIPQFLFFKSTPGLIEQIEPVCFLSSEGQSSAADCATVRARAGKKKIYQMYRATIRYKSPADDREHIETIVTRALGPIVPGTTWNLLAHTYDANRVQPRNDGGRALLFGASVLLFVVWLRGVVNRFVRRTIQGARSSSSPSGPLGPVKWVIGAIAFAVFFIFFRAIKP